MRHKDLSLSASPARPARSAHPRLRAELERQGKTIADLVRVTGLSSPTLYRTFAGVQRPSDRTRRLVADALGLRGSDLWDAA